MLGSIRNSGNAWDDAGENGFGRCHIGLQMADHCLCSYRCFLNLPAIVIRDHCQSGEGDLRLAGQPGFRGVGHADEVGSHHPVHRRLGAGLAGIRGEPEGADDPGDDDASGRDEETAAVSTDTRITPDEEAGYRALRWADVQALAGETQATRHFTPPVIELRLPRAEARTPLQVAPR